MSIVVGIAVIVVCVLVWCATVALLSHWLRRFTARAGHVHDFIHDTAILCFTVLLMLAGNLAQALIWALLFRQLGEFRTLSRAFYFALESYTTLGYGDIILTDRWAVLGPLAAAHGIIMMGLSISVLFWLMTNLVRASPR